MYRILIPTGDLESFIKTYKVTTQCLLNSLQLFSCKLPKLWKGKRLLRFKRYLTIVAIFQMSLARLPAFHFEFGVPFFWALLRCRFKVETDEFVLQFIDPLLPSIPFNTLWRSPKIFSGVPKRKYLERNPWAGISKGK